MTKEQINIAIAEHIGWKIAEVPGAWGDAPWVGWVSPCGKYSAQDWEDLPNYSGDLNAMHEAWKALTENLKREFETQLHMVIWGEHTRFFVKHQSEKTTNATALERATAYVRAVGKWKES